MSIVQSTHTVLHVLCKGSYLAFGFGRGARVGVSDWLANRERSECLPTSFAPARILKSSTFDTLKSFVSLLFDSIVARVSRVFVNANPFLPLSLEGNLPCLGGTLHMDGKKAERRIR